MGPKRLRPGRLAMACLAALAAVLVAGCSARLVTTTPASTPTAFAEATDSDVTSPDGNGPQVSLDTGLLAVLPATVFGLAVEESPEGDQSALEEPVLDRIATAAIGAVVVDTSTTDLAYALVVRLKPGALADAGFRDWRDSYDEGACGNGSLIVGHSQTSIAGRTVYIATCSGGLRTYHVWIQDKHLLISVSSLGARHFGEVLIANLKP
jgi:hypothetical protein